MSDQPKTIEEIIGQCGGEPLELTSTFVFECQPSCWGTCCRNIDVTLSPYDVWRLSRHLGKTMMEFIHDHCYAFPGHDFKWPIVILREATEGACEFLRNDGACAVWEARPSVCRSCPVGRIRHEDAIGEMKNAYFLRYPHSLCQKKNATPATTVWTAEDWIKANQCEEWWRGSDRYYNLIVWACKELDYEKWATDTTFEILMPLLYGVDVLTGAVAGKVDEEEMWRYSEEAVKYVLSHLAGGYGYGPQKDLATVDSKTELERSAARAAVGAAMIIKTGKLDEQAMETVVQDLQPSGFMVIYEGRVIKKWPSFELEDAEKVLEFLREAARRFEPVHRYLVVINDQMESITGDELLRRSRLAQIKRLHERRRLASQQAEPS